MLNKDNTGHLSVYSQQCDGCTLVQVKGSRVSLLYNVHVRTPCVEHGYENKRVC